MFQDDGNDGGSAAELGLDNVGGVFVVLVSGASLACLIALFEFVWEICKKKEKVNLNCILNKYNIKPTMVKFKL